MGQGQDKVAQSLVDMQPTAIIELFQLYFNTVDKPSYSISFHGGSNFSRGIVWNGITYNPIPVETEGFEVNGNGQMARPKIRISNKDRFVTSLLNNNQDLQFAKIIRRRTFVKYLDNVNFDGGNPWGQADPTAEISHDTFVISQKTAENRMFVEFELSSPLDLDNFEVNNRLVMARYCGWYYRGVGCNYQGPPIETEDGRDLPINVASVNSWAQLVSPSGGWVTGKSYASGDPAFLENKKVIINPNIDDQTDSRFARIWYVCQQDHISNFDTQPDLNITYWSKDGCNKKLDGCKKRFQNTEVQNLGKSRQVITNNYIDFSYLKGWDTLNNVAPKASATASSVASGYKVSSVKDGEIGYAGTNPENDRDYSWASNETAGTGDLPWVRLTWSSPQTIDRLDFYDRPSYNANFNGARVIYYNNSLPFATGTITDIPQDGSRITSGFSPIVVDSILVSGVGSDGAGYIGLGEIAAFQPTGSGEMLCIPSMRTDAVHRKPHWQISTYFNFPSKIQTENDLYSIYHNVKPNCAHSGINLYISGGARPELFLRFATVEVSGAGPQYTVKAKTLRMPWSPSKLQPLHIQTVGGTSVGDGYIEMRSDTIAVRYNLATKRKNSQFSGEFFMFKDAAYQGGIGDFQIGINNWQFTNTSAYPAPADSHKVRSNIKTTSNFRLGSMAIWTGNVAHATGYKTDFFNRDIPAEAVYDQSLNDIPRTYGEIGPSQQEVKVGLYGWWDMEVDHTPFPAAPPYIIENSNSPLIRQMHLSGAYDSRVEYSTNTRFMVETGIPQEKKTFLPFGGFPGTDRYGR